MPGRVDLHTHTCYSDGRLTPRQLLDKAAELGVRVLSITDHDTTDGLREALSLPPDPAWPRIIPGIEISAEEGEETAHILGYGIDPASVGFQQMMDQFRARRVGRMKDMIAALAKNGIVVSLEQVQRLAGLATLGRPHLADALVENKVVRSRSEAFQRYLKKDGPAYVSSDGPGFHDVITLIRKSGGVPVLAHPSFYSPNSFIEKLAHMGLMGIEVYYPDTSRALRSRYLEMAEQLNLIATGGSDYHGPRTGRHQLACVDVPESAVSDLEKARERL